MNNFGPKYLDSPSTTSATTYKIQWQMESGVTGYLNRNMGYNDNNQQGTAASSITVMEILA